MAPRPEATLLPLGAPGGEAGHRHHRAGGGIGGHRPRHPRRRGARGLHPHRREALDHRGRHLTALPRVLPHRRRARRRGDRRGAGRARRARLLDRRARPHHGAPRHPGGPPALRPLPCAERERARRAAGRIQEAHAGLQRPACRGGRSGPRPGPGRLRAGPGLRGGAAAVRAPDRRVPGDPMEARGHGDRARRRPSARLPRRGRGGRRFPDALDAAKAKRSRPRPRSRSPAKPSRSTARPATAARCPSSAWCATPGCSPSGAVPSR